MLFKTLINWIRCVFVLTLLTTKSHIMRSKIFLSALFPWLQWLSFSHLWVGFCPIILLILLIDQWSFMSVSHKHLASLWLPHSPLKKKHPPITKGTHFISPMMAKGFQWDSVRTVGISDTVDTSVLPSAARSFVATGRVYVKQKVPSGTEIR